MTEIDCDQVEDMLAEYALGILPFDEADAVRSHAVSCLSCRHDLAETAKLADRLGDLVTEVEVPPGFDRLVVDSWRPRPLRRRRVLWAGLAAVAAAAALVISVLVAGSDHHAARKDVLTAQLLHQGRSVGTVYIGGDPEWINMTVSHADESGNVTCEVLGATGSVTTIGTFDLVDGNGSWGVPDPAPAAAIVGVRLVDAGGAVIAAASLAS